MVGLFSRDLSDLRRLLSSTMNLEKCTNRFPSKILYPLDFFPYSDRKHQAMVDEFVGVLERFLGAKRMEFSIAERWEKCPPREAEGKPLKQYLAKVRNSLSAAVLFPYSGHLHFLVSECLLVDVPRLLPRL